MADVTITIDGNTTQLVTSAKKAQDALKRMGDSAGDAGKKMGGAGREAAGAFEKTAASMGRTLIGAHAIVRALTAARDKAVELQAAMVSSKAEQGGLALRGARAAAAGGFDQKVVSSFIEQISPASQAERAGFIESLSTAELGLSNQRFSEGLQAVASGAFTPQQALEALKNGGDLNVQNQLQKIGPAGLKELETLRGIDEQNARTRGSGFNDQGFRVGAAAQQASDLANPGLASVRAAVGTLDFSGAGGIMANNKSAEANLQRIAENTSKIEGKKLNVSATTDNQ